jgi:uncharacterized membrane protein YphA (DoxX/SURF4 family)
MLSLFPQILFLAPFSAALLRVVAGLVFADLAYFHFNNRRAATEELSTMIGGARTIIILYGLIEAGIALCLIIGLWTQAAAILGCVIAVKMLFIRASLRKLRPFSQLSYALLAVICLSLLITGAGIFAVDLPL